jgi:uncharacterized protein
MAWSRSTPTTPRAVIPGGMYRGNDEDTETFGVAATFVASTAVDEDIIYETVKAVFENFDRFKRCTRPSRISTKRT